jgi:hypothetical protein
VGYAIPATRDDVSTTVLSVNRLLRGQAHVEVEKLHNNKVGNDSLRKHGKTARWKRGWWYVDLPSSHKVLHLAEGLMRNGG